MNVANKTASDASLDQPYPIWFMLLLPIYAGVALGIFLFPVARDWRWLEGWAFTITIALNIGISYLIINQKNPRVIRNRAQIKKEGLSGALKKPASSDRIIIPLMGVGAFGAFIVAGLSHRFGWTRIPLPLEILGLLLCNAGTLIMNLAMLQNSYASKVLDIRKEQVLVDTGLYAHVRHPLYAGGILLFLTMPIALGSWWGLIPATVAALALIIRIKPEEELLVRGLDGYRDYQERVRYKLVPGIF